jgi:hypothetical protein
VPSGQAAKHRERKQPSGPKKALPPLPPLPTEFCRAEPVDTEVGRARGDTRRGDDAAAKKDTAAAHHGTRLRAPESIATSAK